MNGEKVSIWKESIMACFKIMTDENPVKIITNLTSLPRGCHSCFEEIT
jgi:hypothetical protein